MTSMNRIASHAQAATRPSPAMCSITVISAGGSGKPGRMAKTVRVGKIQRDGLRQCRTRDSPSTEPLRRTSSFNNRKRSARTMRDMATAAARIPPDHASWRECCSMNERMGLSSVYHCGWDARPARFRFLRLRRCPSKIRCQRPLPDTNCLISFPWAQKSAHAHPRLCDYAPGPGGSSAAVGENQI